MPDKHSSPAPQPEGVQAPLVAESELTAPKANKHPDEVYGKDELVTGAQAFGVQPEMMVGALHRFGLKPGQMITREQAVEALETYRTAEVRR